MWFLTHVGIDRYNGKEIKHYKLKEGDRELDPLLNINWTYLDKTGTLLVTGKQGRISVMIQDTIVCTDIQYVQLLEQGLPCFREI